MRLGLILGLLAAAACSESDSDDGFVPTPSGAIAPAAVAGEDFKVLASAVPPVSLKGDKSHDPAGGILTFEWVQVSGTPVALSSPTAANPTFAAPTFDAATLANNTLTFRLTVTGAQGSDSDTVSVTVKKVLVSAPDTWFVGYGKTGLTLTAAAQGGSGTYTYQWSGLPTWLSVTGGTSSAALTFDTPALTDFQNFPDRAEVAVLERTTQGRLQLMITAADAGDATATDFDEVNLSVGPFADAVANENAALGEAVFLNGSPATTWTWSGTKPNGAVVAFYRPDKAPVSAPHPRFVYFVPDLPGAYEIQVKLNDGLAGEATKTFVVNAGKYVGVGTLTGKAPDPFRGECASCHGGQLAWLDDFATPWKQTGHARMFERLLDPADPLHASSQAKGRWIDAFDFGSNYSVDSRTVGWSRPGPNPHEGWAHQAEAEGYVFKDSTWAELVRKHPRTAGLSNVQCESCHGPGSEHAGDSTAIRKSYDAAVCGRCHSRKQDLWEAGGHGRPVITSPSGNASCNNCHTAQGYVVEMRAQEGADPHTALFAVSNVNRPVIPLEDRRGTTCQACHEPHKRTAKLGSTGADPQLRAYGSVRFRNDAVAPAGEAATCYTCHQSRTDTRLGSPDTNVRRAPHDSTAAEMLTGTNGHEFAGWTFISSPHGIPDRFVTPSKGQNRQCLACHADVQPAAGEVGYGALGGHTFAVRQGDGTDLVAAASPAYPLPSTDPATKRVAVASGPSFLKRVFPGDTLTFDGSPTVYEVEKVESARQLTLRTAPPAAVTTSWSLTSVPKYNVASCAQCHPPLPPGTPFTYGARGNYDGTGGTQSVQQEIAGLLAALRTAVETKLAEAGYVGQAAELAPASGRIKYKIVSTGKSYTFPGPGVALSELQSAAYQWSSLTPVQQAAWEALYRAAYNYVFVTNDHSEGIHNTGYAVNLLQASYKAVTGATIGTPFTPY